MISFSALIICLTADSLRDRSAAGHFDEMIDNYDYAKNRSWHDQLHVVLLPHVVQKRVTAPVVTVCCVQPDTNGRAAAACRA